MSSVTLTTGHCTAQGVNMSSRTMDSHDKPFVVCQTTCASMGSNLWRRCSCDFCKVLSNMLPTVVSSTCASQALLCISATSKSGFSRSFDVAEGILKILEQVPDMSRTVHLNDVNGSLRLASSGQSLQFQHLSCVDCPPHAFIAAAKRLWSNRRVHIAGQVFGKRLGLKRCQWLDLLSCGVFSVTFVMSFTSAFVATCGFLS